MFDGAALLRIEIGKIRDSHGADTRGCVRSG
jgi:hypothetical protein